MGGGGWAGLVGWHRKQVGGLRKLNSKVHCVQETAALRGFALLLLLLRWLLPLCELPARCVAFAAASSVPCRRGVSRDGP